MHIKYETKLLLEKKLWNFHSNYAKKIEFWWQLTKSSVYECEKIEKVGSCTLNRDHIRILLKYTSLTFQNMPAVCLVANNPTRFNRPYSSLEQS